MLGLDIGDRRIGIAHADALGITAQGLATLQRKSLEADLKYMEEVISQQRVDTIVVGLPKNMDGTEGPQSEKVRFFIDQLISFLKKKDLEIVYWDERLTSVAAHKSMLEGDLSRRKRKKSVDRISAVFILQGYLDRLALQSKQQMK